MKPIYVLFVTFFCIVVTAKKELDCSSVSVALTLSDQGKSQCTKLLYSQIGNEMNTALKYLSLGVHFAQDTNHRPGFSKLFFEAANEEREHAIKIIEYYLMRGDKIDNEIPILSTSDFVPKSGIEALTKALEWEKGVTKNIKDIIVQCEATKNYHLVDYLTTVFLEEQYKGQRDLAGKIATLEKMQGSNKIFGEFLFDKKLLNGEV